jgi:hypothetical protein
LVLAVSPGIVQIMQWWNDVVAWFNSAEGRRVITLAIVPFLAIVVAGIVAALIARSSTKRLLAREDREIKAAAIMALIGAGRRAAIWSSLGADEKQHVDALISESDLRMRLLPVSGAIAAADWATHELNAMKTNSANFSFQAEQTFFDYRDRLLDWQLKPAKAKKLFAFDLVQWQYENNNTAPSSLVLQQQEYSADANRPSSPPVTTPAPAAPMSASTPPPSPSASTAAMPVSVQPPAKAHSPVFEPLPKPSVEETLRDRVPVAEPIVIDGPVDRSDTSEPTDTAVIEPLDSEDTVLKSTGDNTASTIHPADLHDSSGSAESDEAAEAHDEYVTGEIVDDSRESSDDRADAEAQDEHESPFAPPVNAGAVRARTAPDRSLDNGGNGYGQ